MDQTYTGIVKFYNADKGYGFVKADEAISVDSEPEPQEDFFFHISDLIGWEVGQEPQKEPADRVEFTLGPSKKGGMKAFNVTKLGAGAGESDAGETLADDADADEDEVPMAA